MAFDLARAKSLFLAASSLAATERPAFLDRECGGDTQLREHVEALLRGNTPVGNLEETKSLLASEPAPTWDYHESAPVP